MLKSYRWIIGPASIILVILTCISAGCFSYAAPPGATITQSTPGEQKQIAIKNFTFDPSSLTVKPGVPVIFTNMDRATHSVIADNDDPELFATAPLVIGAAQPIILRKPGTYAYHCEIHPSMKGTIIVLS